MPRRLKVTVQGRPDRSSWNLVWWDRDKKKQVFASAGTADLDEAKALAADYEYKLAHGIPIERTAHHKDRILTWEEFRTLYNDEYLCHLKPSTQEKAHTVFDLFQKLCKPESLADCDTKCLTQFAAKMRVTKPKSRNDSYPSITIRNYQIALKTAFGWASKQGLIEKLPEIKLVKVLKKKPQPVPAEAFERLYEVVPTLQWKAFLACGWYAGLRLSEVWQLTWAKSRKLPWVDFGSARIVLPAEFVKSGEDEWVPMHSELVKILKQLRDSSDDPRPFRMIGYRGQEMTRAAISSKVCYYAKKAGVQLSMHKTRKGFGCRVAKTKGRAGAAVLHRLMRHKSMQVTMDYYASVDDVLADAIEEVFETNGASNGGERKAKPRKRAKS